MGLGPYKEFRASLGKPSLRETFLILGKRIEDEAELAKHIETLLKLSKRPPLAKINFDLNRRDYDQAARLLMEFWIDDHPHESAVTRNFCFYSDRAMAKMVYYLAHQKRTWLPATLLNKEPERIRKLYRSLGLVPAKPRAIKDVELRAGNIYWVYFKGSLTNET